MDIDQEGGLGESTGDTAKRAVGLLSTLPKDRWGHPGQSRGFPSTSLHGNPVSGSVASWSIANPRPPWLHE